MRTIIDFNFSFKKEVCFCFTKNVKEFLIDNNSGEAGINYQL